MAPPLLHLKQIELTFGGHPLLESAELAVSPFERLCLVGRNGSGKSTLLKIAAGLIEPDSGERFAQPGATIRYLAQEPDLSGFATTLAYVESGLGPSDDPYRASALLNELGLSGEESPANLSGGEARRAALAHVLAPEPDILLLDEPTNHLDLPAIEWLEGELKRLRSAMVLISHDRRFLQNLSRATVWLDRGSCRRLDQGFGAFETWRDETIEKEQSDRHKLDRKIAAETQWLHYGGVTARRKRNQGRLGRLNDLRQERAEARQALGTVKMAATEGATSGKLVAEAIGVSKSFGSQPIIANLDLRIARGDRIGIVGPNGVGKTTLLKLLTGELAPDTGTIRLGTTLQMVHLDQRRESLDPGMTLKDALTGGRGDTVSVGGQTRHVVSYMKDFLFGPEQARTEVGALSGGERGRLTLARALAKPSNLLILDEPTNDLDLETLDLLQELLGTYDGTVLLVSHDRDFLDRVVTSVLASEGGGRWLEYAGGYSDMVAQRGFGVSAREVARAERNGGSDSATPVRQPQPSPAAKRKLTFKEKHALDSLPGKMEQLNTEIMRLQQQLADPGLFARDAKAFHAASDALARAQGELQRQEEQWLELELLREELNA